jgi:hypothetical protein
MARPDTSVTMLFDVWGHRWVGKRRVRCAFPLGHHHIWEKEALKAQLGFSKRRRPVSPGRRIAFIVKAM